MWVKIMISHGPGHQSETTKYFYFTRGGKKNTIDMRIKEYIEESLDLSGYDWPIVTHKKLGESLPRSVHKDKTERYYFKRDNAIAMLDVLTKTKITEEYGWFCNKCNHRSYRSPDSIKLNRECSVRCPGKLKKVMLKDGQPVA